MKPRRYSPLTVPVWSLTAAEGAARRDGATTQPFHNVQNSTAMLPSSKIIPAVAITIAMIGRKMSIVVASLTPF